MAALRVHVGGVTFVVAPPIDSVGLFGDCFGIVEKGFTGWLGRPATTGGGGQRSGAHGEYDVPGKLGGRLITISGVVLASTLVEREAMCERLSGLGADSERLRVVVERNGRSTWAWCRVFTANVDEPSSAAHPRFQIVLKAANPRRYGEERDSAPTSTTRHLMLNRGNFPAAPRFVVTGPQPGGYSIVADGRSTWQANTVLPAGQVDVVDFATGRTMRGPSVAAATTPVVSPVLAPRPWLVPGGGEQPWYAAPTGAAGSVRGFITDTYV